MTDGIIQQALYELRHKAIIGETITKHHIDVLEMKLIEKIKQRFPFDMTMYNGLAVRSSLIGDNKE